MIGSHLVERLLAEQVEVRAFLREQSRAAPLAGLPIEIVRGELRSPADAARAVDGCDWIFHAAGKVTAGSTFGHSPGGLGRYIRGNVEPTATLLRASASRGASRFVYVSSASVYDFATPSPIGETAPLRPATDYGRSKLQAEELVRSFADELGTTVVRPSLVYGEGDRHFLPAVVLLARLPLFPLVGGGDQLVDLVAAADVAQLVWLAAHDPVAVGATYNAASGAPLPMRDLVAMLGELLGRAPRTCSVPPRLVELAVPLARTYLRIWSPSTQDLISRRGIKLMARDLAFDISRAREELGYVPAVGLREGLAAALASMLPAG